MIDSIKMGGFYRGFPIYPKEKYIVNLDSNIFEKFIKRLLNKNIKVTYFKNISNHNEPLFKYENYLDYFFQNKKLLLTKNVNLKNTNSLLNKVFFLDLKQSFSFFKVSKIKKEIANFDKEIDSLSI